MSGIESILMGRVEVLLSTPCSFVMLQVVIGKSDVAMSVDVWVEEPVTFLA